MASGKSTGGAKKTSAKGTSKKKTPSTTSRVKTNKAKSAPPSGVWRQILPFVFYVCALLSLLILVLPDEGVVVHFLRGAMFGLLSVSAYATPVILILLGVFWHDDDDPRRVGWRFWCSFAIWLLFATLMHILLSGKADFSVKALYDSGVANTSGGVVGGLLGSVFITCFGRIISIIIIAAILFVLCLLLFGLTPAVVFSMLRQRMRDKRADRRERIAEYDARQRERLLEEAEAAAETMHVDPSDIPPAMVDKSDIKVSKKGRGAKKFNTDVDMSQDVRETDEDTADSADERDEIDKKIFDEVMRRTRERYGEQSFEANGGETQDNSAKVDTPSEAKSTAKVRRVISPEPVAPADVTESGEGGGDDISDILNIGSESTCDTDTNASANGDNNDVSDDELDALLRSAISSIDPNAVSEVSGGLDDDPGYDDDDIEAMVESISEPDGIAPVPDEPDEPVKVYEFPPISLLTPPAAATSADLEELRQTAQRLVDTLRSFKVKTKISDVAHGPTITRYELTPETGTRVSAIANLSDDIALNLAAQSVRIEAPIPGKAAVGVEVPNRVRETVSLRQLLETDQFANAKSLLTAALGCDVAGAPVYCDIAKMPHLLIAGTTGGGKSVCINCIIMSILYRARPDQVRLIMIDPKQVEFVPYDGIPHLHVPVVCDAKKAAGTLSWAVGEMEKRYEMIRDVGVRNIDSYNKVTENDPEKQFMPYLVIIIDELADLMMTAPDDVETSICRIAQKGRAAGVHVIIGTQRPSVDVVTGLIKANFPSRIALTVAQQVDSRTILGTGGAEKLLGRGDMLYAPIGSMKPQRVQGAFVSDSEVEVVTDFLKGSCPVPHYDEDAIEGIEEAARQCGAGKKGRGAAASSDDESGGGETFDDPMLRQALELAVDSGKISTSLIQRRLSLGYGRAAKLIDRMETLGYVGPPDGPRPREVLISRQQFQEIVLRGELD